MMENKKEIKSLISNILLTFIGMWVFIINLINVFYEEDFYSCASMICVVLIFSVIFSTLMHFIKKNWIVLISVIAIMGIVVWINFDAVTGGCAYCVNIIIEQYGAYFGKNMLYLDYTKSMLRDYNPAFFVYLVVILLTLVNSFAINKKKLAVIPLIFTLAALFIPVIIELFPSTFAMIMAVVYIIMLMVVINAKTSDIASSVALCFGVIVFLVGGILSLIKPSDEFEQNEFFPEFREEVKLFISNNIEDFQFIEGNRDVASVIGGGALGHVDSLEFSNKEVLKVTLPAMRDTIYIKGYIGQDYSLKGWKEPDKRKKVLFEQLQKVNYSPAAMTSTYLEKLGEKGTLTGIRGKMKLEYTMSVDLYEFAPIYPVVTKEMAPYHDGAIENIPRNEYIEYFSIPDEVFKVSDEYIKEVLGDEYYQNNKLYMDYVYDNYMDVNTPIADELEQQWSKYPTDTAKERYVVAYAIREYLKNTCTYTVSPGKVPKDKDFVEYFLKETKEGYCTYFATSAVMMFRSAGIPARYVEGYAVDVSSREDVVEYLSTYVYSEVSGEKFTGYCEVSVKDNNAHAWVEFYIDGIGWVDFEVTPGNGIIGSSQEKDDYNINPESFGEKQTEEPTTEEPTTNETTSENESKEEETTTKKNDSSTSQESTVETTVEEGSLSEDEKPSEGNFKKLSTKAFKTILIVLGISGILFLVVAFIIVRHKKLEDTRKIYNNNEQNLGKLAVYYYNIYLRLMKHIKIFRQDYMTNTEFAEYVEQTCEFVEKEEAKAIATIQEKAEYAPTLLTKEEVNNCKQYVENIRDRIYLNKNFIQKLIFKYIYNL